MPALFQAMLVVYTYFQLDDFDKNIRRDRFATCNSVFPSTAVGFRFEFRVGVRRKMVSEGH